MADQDLLETYRALLDEKDARISELEALLSAEIHFPVQWALTPTESRILAALLRRTSLSKDALMAIIYDDMGKDRPEIKIIDVLVCKLRKKLGRFGFSVKTDWGIGYRLEPSEKQSIHAACGSLERGVQ